MTKIHFLLGATLCSILLFTNCVVTKQNKENKRRIAAEAIRPPWVTSTIGLDSDYYWGTAGITLTKGLAPTKSQTDQVRQRAYNDIASQISVKVASQTLLSNSSTSEATKSVLRQNMQQTIRLSAQQHLDGVELIEKYSDEFGYFELYRLSITKHQEMRSQRINTARNEALSLLNKASEYKTSGNYRLAIINTLKALHGLSEYANDDLSTPLNGTIVNPLVEADKMLAELIIYTNLKPLQSTISARVGETIDASKFGFQLTTPSGKPISGVKLSFKADGLTLNVASGITDMSGIWCDRFRMNSLTASNAQLAASIDIHSIVSSSGVSNNIAQIALAHPAPTAHISIHALPPQIHIIASDNTLPSRIIKTAIEKEFASRNFELSTQAPSISITSSLRPERHPNYLTVNLNVSLTWIDAQGYNKTATISLNESGTTEQAAVEKLIAAFEKEFNSRIAQQIIKSMY